MARPDPHSVFDDAQPRLQRLEWRARIDFAARAVVAEARLLFDGGGAYVDLDTRDLTIERVSDDDGARLEVERGATHPFLGQRLRVLRPRGAVRIRYRTLPTAMALDWSNQSVYSQCQPIFARSLVPLPDSPSSRITVGAELTAPRALTALMAAAQVSRHETGDEAVTTFEMAQPIPPYLLALAVGDYVSRELSSRSRVWASPSLIEAAAGELAPVERMMAEAERLFGPYRWERFDLLVAPPSFPYGGMENPRLAFLSPSLLVGDRSLLSVVAHELAHAWSGNLVSAASLEHFWLNEAFTVWGERRLVAAVADDGAETARLQAALGRRDLERALAAFAANPERTRLRTHLDGVDPDEALSVVPYEKGYLLLRALEANLGPAAFATLARGYFDRFAGRSITSEQFVQFAALRAPGFDFEAWLAQPGVPAAVAVATEPTAPAALPPGEELARWTPWRWRWFLDGLPRPSPLCAAIDQWFNHCAPAHPEVRTAWLTLAVDSDYAPALAQLDEALRQGRLKYLRPIYLALALQPSTRERAGRAYRQHRERYHPIARLQLERLLRALGVATQEVKPLGLGRRP